jgi:hypothetical protein
MDTKRVIVNSKKRSREEADLTEENSDLTNPKRRHYNREFELSEVRDHLKSYVSA